MTTVAGIKSRRSGSIDNPESNQFAGDRRRTQLSKWIKSKANVDAAASINRHGAAILSRRRCPLHTYFCLLVAIGPRVKRRRAEGERMKLARDRHWLEAETGAPPGDTTTRVPALTRE